MLRRALLLSCAILLSTGCARREMVVTASELQGASLAGSGFWTRDELYFGMRVPTGGMVTDSLWKDFVEREVVTRFPDGFTIFEATGYWRDRVTGRTEKEPCRVMLVYYREEQAQTARLLGELAAIYKQRFNQQSVLRVTARVRAAF
jgi:hypothetical protein